MRKVVLTLCILFNGCLSKVDFVFSAENRGVVVPKQANQAMEGEYWAFIIGIDDYGELPKLDTAVNDAKAVRDILVQKYGFKVENIKELYNRDATRENIVNIFFELTSLVQEKDSLLIYYAGHGVYHKQTELGSWVPADGRKEKVGTYIPNSTIKDYIAAIKSRHTYLIADSCFSGSLLGISRNIPPSLKDTVIMDLYSSKSRWGLTSGTLQPVADGGRDGHSIFAYFFLKILGENNRPFLIPSQIFNEIMPLVANNSDQRPLSQPILHAGDEGGQFVFRLASAKPLDVAAPTGTTAPPESPSRSTDIGRPQTLPPTIISYRADRTTLDAGQGSKLYWRTENATEVTINGMRVAESGSVTVHPTRTSQYILATSNNQGKKESPPIIINVSASPPRILSYFAQPRIISGGQESKLYWRTENATEVTINGQKAAASGSVAVHPSKTSRYVLVTKNSQGKTEKVVQIDVR